MKVWFDHQIFSIQRYGGVSRYFVELLRALRRIEGVEADVVAPAHVNAYLAAGDAGHPLTFPLSRPTRGLRFRPRITAPLFRVASHLGRPDVVHETHYALGGTHLPRRARVVTTCHDMIFERFPDWVGGADERITLKRHSFRRADAVICISAHTRDDLLGIYPELAPKVRVVHHGVDHTPAPDTLPVALPEPYLLFVGVRHGYKNFDGMVRALGASRQLREHFNLVCFGGGPLAGHELALAQAAGFPPGRIHHLSGDDLLLAYLYKRAEAFVFPSRYEGFGMPLTEAMVHGCPIACSRASCFPEIAGEAARYFDPDDGESLRHALETLVGDAALKARLRLRGHARAARFSWPQCARETLAAYRGA